VQIPRQLPHRDMTFDGSILLVDDEPHTRKFVGLLVKQLGNPILFEAADGKEALEVYQRETPDLVLLDISMPVMDGLETLRRLLLLDPDAVVIMLTSLANRDNVDAALAGGAASYLRKDLPKNELIRALHETLTEIFESP
jgi:two-component system chemotaxis response regulator CheY